MTILVRDDLYLKHAAGGHPECPDRLKAILGHLENSDIWDQLTLLEARDATDEELQLVHTKEHVERIRELAGSAPVWIDADTYMNEHSLAAALRAAGGVLAACESVTEGKDQTAFCAVRPPDPCPPVCPVGTRTSASQSGQRTVDPPAALVTSMFD